MELTVDRFAALARSSPWRWRTLRFTVAWRGALNAPHPGVRAWVRRPDGLRVQDLTTGTLLVAAISPRLREHGPVSGPQGWARRAVVYRPTDPRATPPDLDQDGLVTRRPPTLATVLFDDPMYQNYRWVAMLDPAELADGHDWWRHEPAPAPVQIDALSEVEHHGRPAWQADLRPTTTYDPRCSCCALLFSAASEDREAGNGGPVLRDRDPGLRYADAHRVRLDVATGVCVYTEELGGSRPGTGHDLSIEAVDAPMPDELFQPITTCPAR